MSAVEWKNLGEVMQIVRGASPRPINNYLTTDIDGVNWIKIGDVSVSEKYITKTKEKITKEGASRSRYLKPGDFILSNSMSFGRPYILKTDGCIHDGWIAMSNFNEYLISGYLYEVLSSNEVQQYWKMKANNGGAMTNLNSDIVRETLIPIPSLAKQQEIVSHLDTFTSLISNLESELDMRRKQYEHYRNQLLDFEGVEMNLQDFCILKAGKSIKAEEIATEKDLQNRHPCYGGNGIRGYVPYKSHEGEYPIIGRQGALCGCVNWATGEFYATEHAIVVKGKENVEQRFLFILFQNADLNQYKTQGAQPGLSVAKLNELYFSIPSLETQRQIVEKLDTFEQLIQSLETEIKLRKQQYEYYREKLLTFE